MSNQKAKIKEKPYKPQTYCVDLEDIQALNTILTDLKKLSRRKFNKSDLFRGAIALLRQKTPEQVKTLLDSL